MCGLSGWQIPGSLSETFRPKAEEFTLSQNHRGPDTTGRFHSDDGCIYLGHNRLSIIDLSSAGNQPMVSDAGDVMILNGEIYNYQDLKSELKSKGHTFTSQSDSEVVLKSYLEWGLSFTNKIKGMYAIAIWAQSEQVLHLFRDPIGIKPLYYWNITDGKGVAFASEVRAFLSLPKFSASVSRTSLSQYLEFGYCFDQTDTIFEGVSKLQPGHRIEIRDGVASDQIRFYKPELIPKDYADNELEDHLYNTLCTVVKEHLVADVPVGLLLSGGLDSSLIASIASKYKEIHTFSMGFADSEIDERPFARIVSDYIGSNHKDILIEPQEILDDLSNTATHFDDVFADWGMVSTRLLYKKCEQQGMKVVLVGEGSDELFGGYNLFKYSLDTSVRPLDWKLFQLYRRYAGRRYGRNFGRFRAQMKSYLSQCRNDLFSAIRLFETRNQIPNNYVMKVDKASMSVSIEARTPFLDSRISDIAYTISRDKLISPNDEKLILKNVAKRYKLLPSEILERRKFGAGIASNWMEDSAKFRQFARDIVLAPNSWVDELGLRQAMELYFDQGKQGYGFPRSISLFGNLAWRILILSLWASTLGVKA